LKSLPISKNLLSKKWRESHAKKTEATAEIIVKVMLLKVFKLGNGKKKILLIFIIMTNKKLFFLLRGNKKKKVNEIIFVKSS
jgi:hypothetical protein